MIVTETQRQLALQSQAVSFDAQLVQKGLFSISVNKQNPNTNIGIWTCRIPFRAKVQGKTTLSVPISPVFVSQRDFSLLEEGIEKSEGEILFGLGNVQSWRGRINVIGDSSATVSIISAENIDLSRIRDAIKQSAFQQDQFGPTPLSYSLSKSVSQSVGQSVRELVFCSDQVFLTDNVILVRNETADLGKEGDIPVSTLRQWVQAKTDETEWENVTDYPVFGAIQVDLITESSALVEIWIEVDMSVMTVFFHNDDTGKITWYHPLNQKTIQLAPSPMVIVPSFALFGKTVFEKYKEDQNTTRNSNLIQSRCVLSLLNESPREIVLTLKVFTPINFSENEYVDLVYEKDPRVQKIPFLVDQDVTDDGWGIATMITETETTMESNNLIQTITRRLRIVAGETLSIPLQRLIINDLSSNNPSEITPFGFLLNFGQDSRLDNFEIHFIIDTSGERSIFDPTNEVKILWVPFLVTLTEAGSNGVLPKAWLSYDEILIGK